MTQNSTEETGTSTLTASQCFELLRTVSLGRIAISLAEGPEIFPVNFVVDHGAVVFRSSRGSKLTAVVLHPIVAFEADGVTDEVAWSVVVKGRAEPIVWSPENVDAPLLPVFPLQPGRKPYYVRIVATQVTGRRFRPAVHSAHEPTGQ